MEMMEPTILVQSKLRQQPAQLAQPELWGHDLLGFITECGNQPSFELIDSVSIDPDTSYAWLTYMF
jgi:hypothetical protein